MPFIDDSEYDEMQGSAPLTPEKRKERGMDDLSFVDQKLINYAGVLPPVKIAELTGIPAEDVARRTLEILNSVDYFTIEQMRTRLIIMLNTMIAEALNRLQTASDKAAPAYMNATGGNIQRAVKELEAMESRAQANHSAMEQAYARRMVDIVNMTYNRQLGRLSERYPEIDASDLAGEFQQTLLQIAREIDAEA